MLRSMYSGISGPRSHQIYMDTVGSNIANVNTTGYKSSGVIFSDMLSQVLTGAGAPGELSGGTNPAQVGLGTRIAGIQTSFVQGATQLTGRATDMAIQGDGFFVARSGGENLYTRAGSLSFDANGALVTPSGGIIQGWSANANGVVDINSPVTDLTVPIGQILQPNESTSVQLGGNLPADAEVGDAIVTTIDIVDSRGTPLPLTLTWTKTGDDAWEVSATTPDPANPGSNLDLISPATPVTFDPSTGLPSIGSTTIATAGLPGEWAGTDVTVDFGEPGDPDGLVQFSGEQTMTALGQDGSEIGFLRSFSIDPSGLISGVFSNGMRRDLGQVALAAFNNPTGLERAGDTAFRATANSGEAAMGVAGTGPFGSIAGGTVEMSNVDLAAEFTNMISAQRGFQANSRVITASDEILQDLVNMKR
ncbi:flagellar hook protein FlgE [Euzebya pacifica]|uniref:flagellar hook protein FlgE n=1 Tax=Euzebya pacifica TaxID=1608957 RepID=UPI0030F64601